ncbi:hypothetical protein NLJ89_g1915 [Agrocybe chaxingu]|uniref:ubiquitinyl hydrolase 1 n=1 Tax=Agrocybe chaxingu TaxID=84603 RepID=A0A9W8MZ50_9AGAR|nr:hypothetical protein NLJ89_g1915 [Agrocybe chaxingu]
MPLTPSSGSSPSNALDSPDPSGPPSRKRQRSQSMQSDSGASTSSVKRSVADNTSNDISVRSPRTDHPSPLNLASDSNQDIDTYMAEQGEADIPTFLSPPPSHPPSVMEPLQREEKFSMVDKGKGRRMEIGETWYLVSRVWYKRWSKACTGEVDKEGPITEQDLGPVDNSALLDSYGNLRPSLAEGVDFEYIPEEIWTLLVLWYGTPSHPLPRPVIARGHAKLPAIELLPLRLKVFRLVKSSQDRANTPHVLITISAGETMGILCSKLSDAVSLDKQNTPYRVWKVGIAIDESASVEFLSSQLPMADAKIVEESGKTLEEEGMESEDAFVVEFKQSDGWIAEAPKTIQLPPATETPRPLFGSSNFFDRMSTTHSSSTSTALFKPSGLYSGFTSTSSKTPSTAVTLASNNKSMKALEPGTLGLGNMGNTCFMNSALQCLAHTKELTDYFLSEVYIEELNRDNPLGMGGAIAEAFGALLGRIWATSGVSTSYSPREFKMQLQRFAPQFSGYQQHDSQELVAFLLDGLHEDLNRVIKKPYVEKPDWEGGGIVELVKLARKSWEGYMLRNDSVIVDLFQGQYQSTLVCPECKKVSITFDPFMYLTLPLPVTKKWRHTIFYVPWDLDKPHVKVPVEISRDASFKELRALLGRWMEVNPENLLTMEIFSHHFYKSLDDGVLVGDMSDSDTIVCFELPCKARQNRAYKKQADDPFLIPVYLCDAKIRASYFNSRSPQLFGYPMVIPIDREQATDVVAMYEVVVNRLSRWTSNAKDLYAWEVGSPSRVEKVPLQNGFPVVDTLTEITEDGKVVEVEPSVPEGDIVDEKRMSIDEEEVIDPLDTELRKVGAKQDIFALRLQINHKDFGTVYNAYSSTNRWESWESRRDEVEGDGILLHDDDAFYCEFDEDKKMYYFGDSRRLEHALWDQWDTFTHPEYEESKKAGIEKRSKGISLQDCLDEFTKMEQLGEDDLWYCPQCKKHQQATKKFDLWKVPDILVVHLKRFSNNRTLRDKIDTHIDFPIEGLNLESMVGEREAAKQLLEQGVNLEEFGLENLDEPLVYDLYAVDEHIGGLGGGHYRAYASNHLTGKWYHFDDSYVSQSRASESVNANAYLLFYRRRATTPLGGKSFRKTQEAQLAPSQDVDPKPPVSIDTQLPTPPNEPDDYAHNDRSTFFPEHSLGSRSLDTDPWTLRSGGSNAGSSVPSPPTDDPPDFEEFQPESLVSYPFDALDISTQRYDFPDPSNKASPTSSNEAEVDLDTDLEQDDPEWETTMGTYDVGVREVYRRDGSPDWDVVSNQATQSYSDISDVNPFSDSNVQELADEDMDTQNNAHQKTA